MTNAPTPDVLRMLIFFVEDPEARECLLRCADAAENLRNAIRQLPPTDQNFPREMYTALIQFDTLPIGIPHSQRGTEN